MRPIALVAVLSLAAVGCASAEEAYSDGMALETAGDMIGAADAYATALERDPALPNVPTRLAIAGREAVRAHLATAAAAGPEPAALAYRAADALVVRAAALGVEVERPASFAADRDASYDAAVRALTDEARAAAPPDAVDLADRARAFGPTPAQAAVLDRISRGAYAAWAEDDLAAGRPRAALQRVDAALALGGDPALAALRDEVLATGAVFVAVFPAEGDDDRFARDVSDVLFDEALRVDDPFVRVADPAAVRTWARRSRGLDLADSPRRLAEAAVDLSADLGVVLAIRPLTSREARGEARTESARTESGGRTPYTVREVRVEVGAEADVVVVDAATRRTVCERRIDREATVRVDVATYAGDWRELELSRSERRAFAADVLDDARAEARDDLRDRLADAAADRIASCLAPLVD